MSSLNGMSLQQTSTLGFSEEFYPESTDVFVAVMGVTGAGKSTFISLCSNKEVKIGYEFKSCTQEVTVYRCDHYSPTRVYLIDTPGFDDTDRSDTEVLQEIATWLTGSYAMNIKINGIIYLNRITDQHTHGSAKRSLGLFKRLCGDNALKNIVLASTRWEQIDTTYGELCESKLTDTPEFWGLMIQKGSQVVRHTWDQASAIRLLDIFASKSSIKTPVVLRLQEEMVDGKKRLDQTAVGSLLQEALAKEINDVRKTQANFQAALDFYDRESREKFQQTEKQMDKKISRLELEQSELAISFEALQFRKTANLKEAVESLKRRDTGILEKSQRDEIQRRQACELEKRRRHEKDKEQELQQKLETKAQAAVQQKAKELEDPEKEQADKEAQQTKEFEERRRKDSMQLSPPRTQLDESLSVSQRIKFFEGRRLRPVQSMASLTVQRLHPMRSMSNLSFRGQSRTVSDDVGNSKTF